MWAKEHGTTLFDPSPAGVNADEDVGMKTAHVLARLLRRAANVCSGECEVRMLGAADVTALRKCVRSVCVDEGQVEMPSTSKF